MPTGFKAGGRVKGSQNKTTINAKNAIEECFNNLGGVEALCEWANENRTDFYKVIYPKLLPLTVSGDSDAPLIVQVMKFAGDNFTEQLEAPALPA